MFNPSFFRGLSALIGTLATAGAALAQPFVVTGGGVSSTPLYQQEITQFAAASFLEYVGISTDPAKTGWLANTPAAFGRAGAVHGIVVETPLTQTQINDYLRTGPGRIGGLGGHGPLIQMPAAGVPVTISYKGPAGPVTLSKQQLCWVMSGAVDKWSLLGVNPGTAPDRFTVIYHADRSGVTEVLTRYLQAVCGPDSLVAFSGKSLFVQEFPSNTPANNFIGANGSDGVVTAMNTYPSAITYLGADPAFIGAFKQAALVNHNNGSTYTATLENSVPALGSTVSLPTATVERSPDGADWLNTNNQANPFNWVRSMVNPPSGYPIVAFSTFVVSQCYTDPAVANAVKAFLAQHYSARNSAADWGHVVVRPIVTAQRAQEMITYINNNPGTLLARQFQGLLMAGYDPNASPTDRGLLDLHGQAPLSPVNRARLLQAFVYGTAAKLEIGNPTVCGDYPGRG